jgi:hypothetical protein
MFIVIQLVNAVPCRTVVTPSENVRRHTGYDATMMLQLIINLYT